MNCIVKIYSDGSLLVTDTYGIRNNELSGDWSKLHIILALIQMPNTLRKELGVNYDIRNVLFYIVKSGVEEGFEIPIQHVMAMIKNINPVSSDADMAALMFKATIAREESINKRKLKSIKK